MPPRRNIKSTTRPSAPQSPRKPRGPNVTAEQTRPRSARSTSRELEQAPRQQQQHQQSPELEAVEEEHEIDVIDPDLEASEGSDISAETHTESQNLNAEDIVDTLPDLYNDTRQLFAFLSDKKQGDLSALVSSIQDATTTVSKRNRRLISRFLETRASFGIRVFISPQSIIRRLRGFTDENHSSIWRPDAILYMANTVFFTHTMITDDEEHVREALTGAFTKYPALFMPPDTQSRFHSTNAAATTAYGSHLRTQLFIRIAKERSHEASFDPDVVLNELFMTGQGDFKGISDYLEAEQLMNQVSDHIGNMRRYFTTDNNEPVLLEQLETAFPWTQFLLDTLQWCTLRVQELESAVAEQGGAETISELLSTGNFDNAETKAGPHNAPATAPASSMRKAKSSKQIKRQQSIARKKEIDRQIALQTQNAEDESQSQSIAGEIAESVPGDTGVSMPDPLNDEEIAKLLTNAPVNQDPEVSTDVDPLQTQQVMAQLALDREQAEKENRNPVSVRSYMDPQPDARRLVFDDHETQHGKRRAGTVASEDEDFETDKRQPSAKRSRPDPIDPRLTGSLEQGSQDLPAWAPDDEIIPSQPTLPPPSPRRNHLLDRNHSRSVVPSSSAPARGRLNDMPVSATAPPSSAPNRAANRATAEEILASQDFRRVQSTAKERGRDLRMDPQPSTFDATYDAPTSSGPPTSTQTYQIRKAWSEAEEGRLFSLIARFGPAYSKILKEDKEMAGSALLQGRSQVQLKDKARNMKFAYLKAGEELPRGFGTVSIGPKMAQKLREMGIAVEGDGRVRGLDEMMD